MHLRSSLKTKSLVLGGAALLAISLVACSPGQGEPEEASPTSSDTSAVDDVTQQSADAAGVDLGSLGEPVATAELPAVVEGDPDATLTVDFYGLRRSGDTVVGTYSFTPNSEVDVVQPLMTYLGGTVWDSYLIDPVNLNKHSVLRSEDGMSSARTAAGATSPQFGPGQTWFTYAVFAAPPSGVDTVNVMFVQGAPMATGVPVE